MTATYIINRIPNSARPASTPFENWFGVKPRLGHLRVFGAQGYVHIDQSKRSKWDRKAHRCIFLGYTDASKTYRVLDLEDERLVVTRTIVLDERPPSEYRSHQCRTEAPYMVNYNWDECSHSPISPPIPRDSDDTADMEIDCDGTPAEPMRVDSEDENRALTLSGPSQVSVRPVLATQDQSQFRGEMI